MADGPERAEGTGTHTRTHAQIKSKDGSLFVELIKKKALATNSKKH